MAQQKDVDLVYNKVEATGQRVDQLRQIQVNALTVAHERIADLQQRVASLESQIDCLQQYKKDGCR